ncbi:DNA-binding TFAR19-related protein [Ignisphaera aggregans DSM 17230]|uniref:DNA-binding protein Igag_1409 n=1 Tax=Ignisphaera aggregans (strain DSM 17230 / JCM 13409 / AQ1.S1) TaxID=583356 RepID=E0SQF6_IGNAA|nr:DNA-binding TFAR19-related protein [Ignisphaera aggregans DSM 17230]
MEMDSYNDEEVAALLEKQYRELLMRRRELERRRLEKEAEEARRQEILRTILTPEARERLANIKLVRPEIAKAVEDRLIVLALQGRINRPITDEELKAILSEIYEKTRREFRISIREK